MAKGEKFEKGEKFKKDESAIVEAAAPATRCSRFLPF
jgi:hypothetical protein